MNRWCTIFSIDYLNYKAAEFQKIKKVVNRMSNYKILSLISIILLFVLIQFTSLFSQAFPRSENGDNLKIKLVTIGPGSELTNFWGHNAIIVEDTISGESYFYNYGLYSFDDNFVYNFVKGRLIFEVGAFRTDSAIKYYRGENRTIQIQTLNLPPQKRLDIARKLEDNIRPENRQYLYHHYLDNCATRIRDLIDRELDGQLKAYTNVPSRMTLRQLTRCFTHDHYIWTWLLMFPMNDSIDKPIKRWDDMFLPSEMEKIFKEFSYIDADGQVKPIVLKEETIYQATGRKPIPDSPPNYFYLTLFISLVVSAIIVLSAKLAQKGKQMVFGLLNVIIGLFAGLLGMFLTLVSLFTDHTIAYYNENLFLTNPVTLLIPVIGIAYLLRKKWSEKWLRNVWYLQLGLGVLLLILKLFPPFDQDNSLALATFMPIYLAFAMSFFRIRRNRGFQDAARVSESQKV